MHGLWRHASRQPPHWRCSWQYTVRQGKMIYVRSRNLGRGIAEATGPGGELELGLQGAVRAVACYNVRTRFILVPKSGSTEA